MRKIAILLTAILSVSTLAGCARLNPLENNRPENQPAPAETATIMDETPTTPTSTWYQPQPGITWQWQLQGDINTKYKVDLYDVDLVETPQNVIDELRSRGIKVICYFSAGSWEKFRDDADKFPSEIVGKAMDGWPDEKWLDISRYQKFSDIMLKRLDLAVAKKCDGVEPDNIQSHEEDTGFAITYEHQLNYNKWLADEAHKRNLAVALKNDSGQIKDLVDYFDFVINEQCFYYDECDELLPFVEKNKAVLGVEYELEPKDFCAKAKTMKFSWMKQNLDLDGGRIGCD